MNNVVLIFTLHFATINTIKAEYENGSGANLHYTLLLLILYPTPLQV